VVTETAPEKTIGYSFDLDGNITQIQETTSSSTRTSSSTYDGIDRLATYTDWAGRTISYTYDNNSNPLTLTDPDGVVTTNSYDNAGRLSKVQMGTASVQYTYDGDGRKSLETYSNGITSAYAYDARGRLTSVTIKNAANAVIGSYAYAVDANSNRTSVTLPDGAVTYQYDADQRLTKEQSTSTSLGAFTHNESYDGAGNRLDVGDTFGPDNRLLTDSGGAYTYDNNGNRTGRGTQTYSYDSYNRLTNYATSGTTATYEYDWEGRRVAKVVNGARREFVYDHARIIAEYNSGVAVAHYAFGADTDEVAIVNRGGNNYFYHQDGLGSVVAITDASGNVVQRYGYDAWGNMKQNTGSFAFSGSGLVNDFTYTGREYDNESALYYYRARSYDPVIGRFLQKDQLQGQLDSPQTRNHYAYAGNSPVNRTDPSGEEEVVGEVGTLNSGVNQAAAAFVGFFAGFGLTNLEFLGQYLGLVNEGVSGPALDAAALALTAARVSVDEETLGIVVSDIGKLNPPGPAAGLPGAFATGFDLKQYLPGLAQKILDTLSALGIKVQTSFGGFQNGAAAAYQRLEQEFQ
jgi:RHS repeat-associated protein